MKTLSDLTQRRLTLVKSTFPRITTLRIKPLYSLSHFHRWNLAQAETPLSMQSNIPSKLMLTTNLDIDRISSLCRPLFEEIHFCHPSFMWAGVFGSVSRGTQRPDSDVDIIVGYSPDADFFVDVCGNMATFLKRLPETLGVEVDIIALTQQSKIFRYIDMEAILSAKTIWGDISWAEAGRDTALDLLQQGYARIKQAGEMMSNATLN